MYETSVQVSDELIEFAASRINGFQSREKCHGPIVTAARGAWEWAERRAEKDQPDAFTYTMEPGDGTRYRLFGIRTGDFTWIFGWVGFKSAEMDVRMYKHRDYVAEKLGITALGSADVVADFIGLFSDIYLTEMATYDR